MKQILFMVLLLLSASCNNAVEKPKNLIEKDKMIDILYDIALLEAIKSQNISGGIKNKDANDYVYKKYNIDSVQLSRSNKYYASDIEEYKKMFEEVKSRIEKETKKAGGSLSPENQDAPQIQ